LKDETKKLIYDYCGKEFFNWKIETQYHFGGYAKTSRLLSDFIREFQDDHTIPLDPVITRRWCSPCFIKLIKGSLTVELRSLRYIPVACRLILDDPPQPRKQTEPPCSSAKTPPSPAVLTLSIV